MSFLTGYNVLLLNVLVEFEKFLKLMTMIWYPRARNTIENTAF